MELFPKQIFSIFDTDAEVLEWAPAYMHVAVVTFFSFVFMTPFNAVINGLGYATLSFVIGMMDGVVARIGLSLLMGIAMDMGIIGFWYGNALAGYVSAILGAAYYFSGRWKTHKLLIDN
jgi:Na+-driven multidrug efflux pump